MRGRGRRRKDGEELFLRAIVFPAGVILFEEVKIFVADDSVMEEI